MMKVAIMGYGTIGSGVARILETNKTIIAGSAGQEVSLKYVLDLRDFPGSPVEDKVIHDFSIIENDPEVRIVVETMGGLNPAYPFVKACLMAGKHVATSNKALVAAHGTELLRIAREKGVNFLFEASVGGGIPIIRSLYRCLMGEKILKITGILNGTTNFILTRMDKEGGAFDAALKEAQRLGYAERDPEADVEGHDTCRKIAILAAMATGKEVHYEDIYTEGITEISDVDFRYADRMGMSIKLFGSCSMGEGDGVMKAYTAPVMIGRDHPLYAVSGVYNGILVTGNMLGETMYYGSGAGMLPTASAVVADIIEAVQNDGRNVFSGWSSERQMISPMEANEFRYFIRMAGQPEERLESLMGLGPEEAVTLEGMDEFAVLTRPMLEAEFKEQISALDGLVKFIRVEQ